MVELSPLSLAMVIQGKTILSLDIRIALNLLTWKLASQSNEYGGAMV